MRFKQDFQFLSKMEKYGRSKIFYFCSFRDLDPTTVISNRNGEMFSNVVAFSEYLNFNIANNYIDSAKSCLWWSEEYLLHFSKAAVFNTAINLKRSWVSGLELYLFQLVILLILNNPTHYKLACITPRLQKFCCLRYISMIYLIFS